MAPSPGVSAEDDVPPSASGALGGSIPSGGQTNPFADSLDWIIRSPRAWVVITCLAVYVRTSFVNPTPAVLAITGTAVVGALIGHLWAER